METQGERQPEEQGKADSTSGEPSRPRFASRRDFLLYTIVRIHRTRRYWLIPVLFVLVILGLILNLFTGYNVLPAIYSLIP
jgi:hypothetical protein